MNKQPLISVITATFNAELLIEKTIKSIENQTYKAIEYVIIDGASSDNTIYIINQFNHLVSYFVSEPDQGIYDAWNKGIQASTGAWISFLGAGDEYLPNALQSYADYIDQHIDELDFVSSIVDIVDGKGNKLYHIGSQWQWPQYLDYMNVAHVGSLHSRKFFDRYGIFDTKYKISGDYELLLRPGPNLKAGYFSLVTANMLQGGMSVSKKCLKEVLNIKLVSGYLSQAECYYRYYLSILKNFVKVNLGKIGLHISIRK